MAGEAAQAVVERMKGIVPSTRAAEEIAALLEPEPETPLARWTVTASSGLEAEHGNFTDACTVTVLARSETEALRRAYALVQRHWYRVQAVEELRDE